LVYLRARHYAPGMGRFLTRDTWSGDENKPISFNAWSYAYTNPARFSDPSGHISCDSFVTFTQEDGKTWLESEKAAVCQSVNDIGLAYADVMNDHARFIELETGRHFRLFTASRAFTLVHGRVEFYRSALHPGWAGQWNDGHGRIEIFDIEDRVTGEIKSGYIARHPRLVVHEMGHAFLSAIDATATGLNFDSVLLRPWRNNNICPHSYDPESDMGYCTCPSDADPPSFYGYYGGFEDWQFGYLVAEDGRWKEEIADMYLGWVYNKWEHTRDGVGLSKLGKAKSKYMNAMMYTQIVNKVPEFR